jgi:diketogulonate reductase-like aldo/keto reductase
MVRSEDLPTADGVPGLGVGTLYMYGNAVKTSVRRALEAGYTHTPEREWAGDADGSRQ